MKKVTVLLLIICLMLGILPAASQAAISPDIQALIRKYNLTVLSKVPCPSKAQKFKTAADAERFIKQANSILKNNFAKIPRPLKSPSSPSLASARKYTKYFTVKTPILTEKVLVTYTTKTNARGGREFADAINVTSYVPGTTICLDWVPLDQFEWLISQDGKSMLVVAHALVKISFSVGPVPVRHTTEVSVRGILRNP